MVWTAAYGVQKNIKTKLLNVSLIAGLLLSMIAQSAPFVFGTAKAAPISDRVVINEIFPSPDTGSEWIELHNPTASDVNLAGWTIKDALSYTKNLSGIIAAGGFLTFDVNSFNNSGDTATLSNGASDIDTVLYDDIGNDESWARDYDASPDFEVRSGADVTKNATNGTAPVASNPEISNLRMTVRDASNYAGIVVDFAVNDDFTDAASLTVEIERQDGSKVTKHLSAANVTDLVNDNRNPGADSISGPFPITERTYTEAGSTSWTGTSVDKVWNSATKPTLVTVTVKDSDDNVIATKSTNVLTETSVNYLDIVPAAAPVAHEQAESTVKRDELPTNIFEAFNAIDSSWYFFDDQDGGGPIFPPTSNPAKYDIVANPSASVGNNGAVRLQVVGDERYNIATAQYVGTELSDIAELGFSTYQPSSNSGNNQRAIYAQMEARLTDVDASPMYQGRLVYVPRNNGSVSQDSWQDWEAIASNGTWRWSRATWPDGDTAATKTWSQIIAQYPDAKITGQVLFRAGEPYSEGFTGYIDNIYLATTAKNVKYNFELNISDTTPPSVSTITAPGARQWFNGSSTVNSWTASTDDESGVAGYQVKYEFVGRSTAYRDLTGTSRTQSFTGTYQGPITISVRAKDNAGNWSAFSKPVTYNYDSVAPTTDIHVGPVVDGKFTVSGSATDNLALNRVYVQLVSRSQNIRCGGTTINLIPNGANADWSKEYNIASLTQTGHPSVSCVEGEYAAHVAVVDRAGNTSSAGWTDNFLVDSTKPLGTITYAGGSEVAGVRYVKSIDELSFTGSFTDNIGLERTSYVVWKVDSNFKNRQGFCGNWHVRGGTNQPLSGTSANVTGSVKDCAPTATWEDGYYEIGHRVYDAVGNYLGMSKPTLKFVIDSAAPVWQLNPVHQLPSDQTQITVGSPILMQWSTATDSNGVKYYYNVSAVNGDTTGNDNRLVNPFYIPFGPFSNPELNATGTALGTYWWQVKACDDLDNCTAWTNPWQGSVIEAASENTEINGGESEDEEANPPTDTNGDNDTADDGEQDGQGLLGDTDSNETDNFPISFANAGNQEDGNAETVAGASTDVPVINEFASAGNTLGAVAANDAAGCSKILGLCWYYWPPIVVAILTGGYYLYSRRETKGA